MSVSIFMHESPISSGCLYRKRKISKKALSFGLFQKRNKFYNFSFEGLSFPKTLRFGLILQKKAKVPFNGFQTRRGSDRDPALGRIMKGAQSSLLL